MTKLTIVTKQIHTVDSYDLDAFISEHYEREFEFVADQESGNDQGHAFNVKKDDLESWHTKDLATFREGGHPTFVAGTLLQDLCNRGFIPEGDYLVKVSW